MIETNRLPLIPYTLELVEATLRGRNELEIVLGYNVSEGWPSPEYAKGSQQKRRNCKRYLSRLFGAEL